MVEERRKIDRRQDCQTCEEHPYRIKEFKNEIGNLVRKITSLCERLDKLEIKIEKEWKDHLQFAEDSLKENRTWKRFIERENSDLRLLIETTRSKLEAEMSRIELEKTKQVDDLKVEFVATTNKIEAKQTSAINKILIVVIAGTILNVLISKFIV